MYGLTHRLPIIADAGHAAPAAARPLRALGSVMVIDRDRLTLQLVHQAVSRLDRDQPNNAESIRARIDAARKVTRRVYLGGGLRHRMAA
jgi:hypothetical protein